MLRRTSLLLVSLSFIFSLFAKDKLTVGEYQLLVDTVSYSKIGPGSTLTQLHLSGEHPLDVHYITIDLTAPGVSLKAARGASANGLEKTSAMANRLSSASSLYFAGVNGDFFDVSTTYPDGTSRPRLSTYTSIIDGKPHKTSPKGYQFIADSDGVPYISLLGFSNSTVSHNGTKVAFGGVNVESINYSGDAAPDNAVTIYTADGWKSPYQTQFAEKCAEVTATIKAGDTFSTTGDYTLVVSSPCSSSGNLTIPQDGFVLLGRGSGKTFIESLKIGDEVLVENMITLSNGDGVSPLIAVGGNPMTVRNGVALDSDGSRPDAVEFHPRTGVGISRDSKRVVMMVIDGRGKSLGATTRMLGDLLLYAGVWNGLNFDGGGSSTCYTAPFGVVNTCSDASGERTVQNSLFAAVSGNVSDSEIAEIRFADYKKSLFSNDSYTPVFYGYNKLGVLVERNLKGVLLSCDPDLGNISTDGTTLKATGKGRRELKASFGNLTASISVEVIQTEEKYFGRDFSSWNKSVNQLKVTSSTSDETKARIDYQMASSVASAKIALVANKELTEDCVGLSFDFNSAVPLKKMEITMKAANDDSPVTMTKTDCKTTGNEWRIRLSDLYDTSNPAIFPLKLNLISLYPADASKSTGYVEFSKIATVNLVQSSVTEIGIETVENYPIEYFTLQGIPVKNPTKGAYIRKQGNSAKKIIL